jgi:hypothetical protein
MHAFDLFRGADTRVLSAREERRVRSVEEARPEQEGGYCLVSVGQLIRCWNEYREGHIEYRDLRVWFAAQELVARRCGLGRGRRPAYKVEELESLVSAGKKRFRPSLRRLEARGLLSWDTAALTFPRPEVAGGQEKRLVPVPRRTIRLLAACTKPVLAATVLAHLIRCLFFRDGECRPRGTSAPVSCSDSHLMEAGPTRKNKTSRTNLQPYFSMVCVNQSVETVLRSINWVP